MPNPYRRKSGRYRNMRGGGGGAPEVSTTFTFVGADVHDDSVFVLRRLRPGGSLAGAWVAWTEDEELRCVSFRQRGVGADPRDWDDRLAGAVWAEADLGDEAASATEVATAFAAAAETLGGAWTVDGAEATRAGASAPLVPSGIDTNTAARGMWGMQRDMGFLDGSTTNGNMGATGAVHLPSPGNGRIWGVYVRADGGNDMRLGLGSGPAYAADPGAITVLGQGVAPAVDNNELGIVYFDEPIEITDADSLWILLRAVNAQLLRFRDVNTYRGDLVDGEQLIWSALTGDPSVAFGATVDVGGGGGPFPLYAHVGIIWEAEDDDGRYPGSGAWDTWAGYLGPATTNADATDPSDMVDETVTFRLALPAFTDYQATHIRQAIGARTAGDDLGIGLYSWDAADVPNFPSLSAAPLLRSVGAFGVSAADSFNTLALSPALDLEGVDVLAIAVNCGVAGGGQAATLQFLYDEDATGELSTDHWGDDGRAWSDWVDENSFGVDTEYQTRTSNGSVMPAGDPAATWPDPFAIDTAGTTDAAPLNAPRMAVRLQRAGITGEES